MSNKIKTAAILLLGGSGKRLSPLTTVINKHLLPVYDKPVVVNSLGFLHKLNIDEIIIVVRAKDLKIMKSLIRFHKKRGVKYRFVKQNKSLGTAHAINLCEYYVKKFNNFYTLWGDGIYEYIPHIKNIPSSRRYHIFIKKVSNPKHFGVIKLDEHKKIKSIIEKQNNSKSCYVFTGLARLKPCIFKEIQKLETNKKGEKDLMKILKNAAKRNGISYSIIKGGWIDIGTNFDALYKASELVKNKGVNKLPTNK